jgi:putative flippase GtrA
MATKRQPMIFIGVGVLNTLLDFGFYTLLTHLFFSDKSAIWVAGILSGTVALCVAFATHSMVTWRHREVGVSTMIRFLVATGFGMWIIRPILLSIFVKLDVVYEWAYSLTQWLHIPWSYTFVANTGAFGLMAIIVLIYNFIVYDTYVFVSKQSSSSVDKINS